MYADYFATGEALQRLREISNFYCHFNTPEMPIWKLEKRGFLFENFQDGKITNINYIIKRKVDEACRKRRENIDYSENFNPVNGRVLAFYPYRTMYDGLAEEVSLGFYDSDDVPPPEFWLFFINEVLYSFIPDEFLERAEAGLNSCLSGCLEWCDLDLMLKSGAEIQA